MRVAQRLRSGVVATTVSSPRKEPSWASTMKRSESCVASISCTELEESNEITDQEEKLIAFACALLGPELAVRPEGSRAQRICCNIVSGETHALRASRSQEVTMTSQGQLLLLRVCRGYTESDIDAETLKRIFEWRAQVKADTQVRFGTAVRIVEDVL